MEQKSKVLATLTEDQVTAFRAIETKKKAAKVLMGQLMAECQKNIMEIMQDGDKFWTDTCKELGVTPSENLFIDPSNNTLCEFVEEEDEEIEPVFPGEPNAGASPIGEQTEPPLPATEVNQESGFDALPNDATQKERQQLAKKRKLSN